jgi:MFS family permease
MADAGREAPQQLAAQVRDHGSAVDGADALVLARPRPTLWILVFAGPALRTSLLGCMLVAEDAIGSTFRLSGGALAILVESIVFGGLLAVLLVPPLIATAGIRKISLVASAAAMLCLAISFGVAPLMSSGGAATAALFAVTTLLGFCVAVLSPVTQTLLNHATVADPVWRHSLQSVWSAGQPAGFILASAVGGLLVERYGWWAALAVPLAFALVSALALLDRGIVPKSGVDVGTVKPGRADIASIILALVAFEVWSTWGSLKSWLEPGVLAALLATVAMSMVAIGWLRRSAKPAVSPAPFAIVGFAAATLILFIYQFPTTAEFEVLLLGELGRMSAAEIGNRTAIGNLAQIAGTALAAWFLLRHQTRPALVAGFALTIVGLAGYTLYPWWSNFVLAASTRAVAGFGSGLLTPVLFVIALNRMPVLLQVAAGTWLVLALIGGTEVGLALFDIVLDTMSLLTGSRFGGYVAVEIAQLAFVVATAMLAWWLGARGRLPLTVGVKPARPQA